MLEDLITHFTLVFDEFTPPSNESSLPPAPIEAPAPKFDYGSSYTRTHTLPPASQQTSHQDFTPTLPPRPGQSIHRRSLVQKKEANRQSMLTEDLSTISESASESFESLTLEATSTTESDSLLSETTTVPPFPDHPSSTDSKPPDNSFKPDD